jgi:hypothetical protein
MIDDYATGRRMNPLEQLMFSAAVHDERLAARFEAFGTRNVDPRRFLPAAFPQAIGVHARRRLGLVVGRSCEAQSLHHAA